MKTLNVFAIVGLVCSLLVPLARGGEPGSPRGSLYNAENAGWFSVSGNYGYQDRDIDRPFPLESQSTYATLSIDPYFDWLTITVAGGTTQVRPDPHAHYDKWGSMWSAGVKAGFWQYDVKDPTYLLSRVRVTGSASYWSHDAEAFAEDFGWDEWRAALLFSTEFFADDLGNEKTTYPYGTVLVIGPVYSDLDVDSLPAGTGRALSTRLDAGKSDSGKQQDWGFLVGVDVYLAHNFSLGWEARTYDGFKNTDHDLHLALHF